MGYATKEDIAKAKEMDLLTYLQNYEPNELVKVANGTYCTREHDSLKISNGKWYWFSRNIGSSTALDYLIYVKGYSLPAAVETILGRAVSKPPVSYKQKPKEVKALALPIRNHTNTAVTRYLRSFNIPAENQSTTVQVFESAIDLLSYATMEHTVGRDWRRDHLLSLAGVFKTKRPDVVPVALEQFLKTYPEIDTIHLRLDNDDIGRGAAEGIIRGLGDVYTVIDAPPTYGKDMNDELQFKIKSLRKEPHER